MWVLPALPTRSCMIALVAIVTLDACSSKRVHDASDPSAGEGLAAIDVDTLASSEETRRRVLSMPFTEATQRLGPLDFEARSTLQLARGSDDREQTDTFRIRRDASDNTHVVLTTPKTEAELFVVGPSSYVRYDRGQLRRSARRDLELGAWTEIAWSSAREALGVFAGRVAFAEPTRERVQGREVNRFRLTLLEKPASPPETVVLPRASVLPTRSPAAWRELAQPLDLDGSLLVDVDTGVPLKLELRGRLDIPDREVRPTQLTLRFTAEVRNIGKIATLTVPASREEFRIVEPPRDVLSFFRQHLDLPPADGATSGANPTPAPTP